MAVGTVNNDGVVGDAANAQVPLDASRAAYLLVHGQEAFFAALAKGDAFSTSTASTEASLSENASSHASPRLEGVDAVQDSPSGGSSDTRQQHVACAGGNVALHLPTKKSRRGNRRRRNEEFRSAAEESASEKRGVVTVNDLFGLGGPGTPASSQANTTNEVSQLDWANAPSPISPCCAVRSGLSSSGSLSTNPLATSHPPPTAPEASTRIAYKAPAGWRSVTQAAPPQLDACAFEMPRVAEAVPSSPCMGLATPLGIVSTTPCSKKIADASARTPPGGRKGPFMGSPMAVRPMQLAAATSLGAATLASSPTCAIGQTSPPNSSLSTPGAASQAAPMLTPVQTPGSATVEDAMRTLLGQGALSWGGADLAAQLMAAAPEAYED